MKHVILILNILAFTVCSCGQATKKQGDNNTTTEGEKVYFNQREEDTNEASEQSGEAESDIFSQFSENIRSKSGIQILLCAGYRGTEPADFAPMLSEDWYDFYRDDLTTKYFLRKATIEIGKFYDDCLADSTTYVHSGRNNLVLVKGITPKNEEISSIPVKKRHVWPGEKYAFSFNGQAYTFRGDGITIKTGTTNTDDGEERWDEVNDYKLYLSGQGTEEQLIVAIPAFNDTFVQILWIGDLDDDKKPDFILDTSRDYEEKTVLLFLSSKAGEGKIVEMVALSSYQFDC